MQFPLHLPRSSIGSFFHPLMGASYTEFVGDIVQGPNLPSTHHRKFPKCDRAPSALLCGPGASRNMLCSAGKYSD
jgi:hypothetical protein